MMIWGLLLLAALVMKAWPETGCARWLHATLIERPLAFVSSIRRVHFIFIVVGFALLYSFAQIACRTSPWRPRWTCPLMSMR